MAFSGRKNLVLTGRTGSGKSATGNSILGRTAFLSAPSATSVTKEASVARGNIDDLDIVVVDGPGLGDTDLTNEDEIQQTVKSMKAALNICPEGFDAILYVAKYGIRFTKEHLQELHVLKCILGNGVLEKFGLFVLTCGDKYDTDENNMTFTEWYHKEMSNNNFREIVKSCGYRVILVNNKTKDECEKKYQVRHLLSKILHRKVQQQRYTRTNFEQAEVGRTRIIVQAYEPVVLAKVNSELTELNNLLADVAQFEPEAQLDSLTCLNHQVDFLFEFIHERDLGTGVLCDIKNTVENFRDTLSQMKERTSLEIESRKRAEQRDREHRERQTRQRRQTDMMCALLKRQQEETRRAKLQHEEQLAQRRRQMEHKRQMLQQQRDQEMHAGFGNIVGGAFQISLRILRTIL